VSQCGVNTLKRLLIRSCDDFEKPKNDVRPNMIVRHRSMVLETPFIFLNAYNGQVKDGGSIAARFLHTKITQSVVSTDR